MVVVGTNAPSSFAPDAKKKDFEADDDRTTARPINPIVGIIIALLPRLVFFVFFAFVVVVFVVVIFARAKWTRERERERERVFFVRDDDLKMGVTLLPHTENTHTQHA